MSLQYCFALNNQNVLHCDEILPLKNTFQNNISNPPAPSPQPQHSICLKCANLSISIQNVNYFTRLCTGMQNAYVFTMHTCWIRLWTSNSALLISCSVPVSPSSNGIVSSNSAKSAAASALAVLAAWTSVSSSAAANAVSRAPNAALSSLGDNGNCYKHITTQHPRNIHFTAQFFGPYSLRLQPLTSQTVLFSQ